MGQIVLDDVIHKAKIQVDERGTEAVALTTAPIINYSSKFVRNPPEVALYSGESLTDIVFFNDSVPVPYIG